MWESRWLTNSAWWEEKRPVSALRSSGSFRLSLPRASSARASGSFLPSQSSASIARPEAPSTRVATDASLMLASSSSFCRRLASRWRSHTSDLR